MTTIKPNSQAPVLRTLQGVQAPAPDQQKNTLQPGQQLRGVLSRTADGSLLLEVNQRQYPVQGETLAPLEQPLQLLVLQTQPTLEFQVVSDPLAGRFAQQLTTLGQTFDWGDLLQTLQQTPAEKLPKGVAEALVKLQTLLKPFPSVTAPIQETIDELITLITREGSTPGRFRSAPSPQAPVAGALAQGPTKVTLNPEQQQVVSRLLEATENLQAHLRAPVRSGSFAKQGAQVEIAIRDLSNFLPSAKGLLPEKTLTLLQVKLGGGEGPALAPEQFPQLGKILEGVRQTLVDRSGAPPQQPHAGKSELVNAGEGYPKQTPVVEVPQFRSDLPLAKGTVSEPMSGPNSAKSELAEGLAKVVSQLQGLQKNQGGIGADLQGRLEGLLGKLSHASADRALPLIDPAPLAPLIQQLQTLTQSAPVAAKGEHLGLLSQLFGFHLESALAQGKSREAMASLKLALLGLKADKPEAVEQPLQRLELLQQCKARFADQQVQFLPLPFPELDEGYLLVERSQDQQQEPEESQPSLQVSLSLRLTGLGNLRIDMLYAPTGLHLRLVAEDRPKMEYLQECQKELQAAIETVPLQGVSYASGAAAPVRQLLERLMPETSTMLDARI